VAQLIFKESAVKHVTGQAIYIDDRPDLPQQLHLAVVRSTISCGKIKSIDYKDVLSAEGVVDVIAAKDVPGDLDIGPVFKGDPLLVERQIEFHGQVILAVVASTHTLAVKAARLAIIEYDVDQAILNASSAKEGEHFVRPPHSLRRGDAASAIDASRAILTGALEVGGQEHFYLEGQVSSAQWACLAAVAAHKTGRPVKMRLSRSDDMIMTGKRHPFSNSYRVGIDAKGIIQGIEIELNGDAGYSPDLTDAIVDRAMFHSDNAYYLDQALITGNRCKTNKVSNTAFRGFGGPQGIITIEGIMDDIARSIQRDPLDVRKANLYADNGRDITPYFQTLEQNNLLELIERVEERSNYRQRRIEIAEFNRANKVLKRGIALTPVKFGISFTVSMLNQAGALIHVYTDGSIHLNHGGTEMGQGLFTKIARVVADEFQIDVENIQVSATRTDKVPNTSPTAASSGTDLNGQAARHAAKTIKDRLIDFCSQHYAVDVDQIRFQNNQVLIGETVLSFPELAQLAYVNRISLSSTGYYRTPEIHYDRAKARGHPFYYYSCGAATSEVLIDTLTGEYKVLQVDITHDVGQSLNEAIDIGQIEGAFIQGMGWLTTEELVWDDSGRLSTIGPATYKIPAISDTPAIFNVEILPDSKNEKATIYHSKAVGEPPLMLAVSVWSAMRDAISSLTDYKLSPRLDTPATPERVLKSISELLERQQESN